MLADLSETRGFLDAEMRTLLVVGLLGGFTTFSASRTRRWERYGKASR